MSLALFTDLYEMTMAYGYWKQGIADREAVFQMHFRKWPFKGGFALMAGLESFIRFVEEWRFSSDDLDYLSSLKTSTAEALFPPEFLHFLKSFTFTCDIDAAPEGSLLFPYIPFVRVRGPLWQAQFLESVLLTLVNFQTLIATKAARICMAAAPDPVVEFGMRRAQGINGAISASRAAFIGGCTATSNLLAARLFGIPSKGTHAHSWVMAFENEEKAFEEFATLMPSDSLFLIDTYDTVRGAKLAIEVAKKIKDPRFSFGGVRLDSGDLAQLSIQVRSLLDRAGFTKSAIMATSELDEYLIRDLKQQGAKIDVWGVGTHLVTGKEQPALDGVYKLSAIKDAQGKWVPKMKLSNQAAKTTTPGILQVRRFFDGTHYLADTIYDELFSLPDPLQSVGIQDPRDVRSFSGKLQSEDLLVPIFRGGKLVYTLPSILEIQGYGKRELERLPEGRKRFINPDPYFVGLEKGLDERKISCSTFHH
ncbi:MAG: nicotinate phosphoribosyltransferase [Verrucomicrobiota bacterium]|nr:nicotinate phosphoribosyltransferase [Verrucomicrobiota bacterium]